MTTVLINTGSLKQKLKELRNHLRLLFVNKRIFLALRYESGIEKKITV